MSLVGKIDALKMAKNIGCSGAHQDSGGNWMPCSSMEELEKISNSAEPGKKSLRDAKKFRKTRFITGKQKRRSIEDFGDIEKNKDNEWEELGSRGVISIDATAGVGITSGKALPAFTSKSALGASIGERAGGASTSSSSGGVDKDGDGKINDGTDDERSAPIKKPNVAKPAPAIVAPKTRGQALPQPKKKKQTIYSGGRRNSRSLMPNGPDPKNYPADKYDLVDEDGKPYQRGKSNYDERAETKAGQTTGPEYVRDNDPDVFIDPESAKFRSRQLGCIGISRRISKTGRSVWMPCTNMSDYSRLAGTTPLGRRGQRRNFENAVRTVVRDESRKLKRKVSIFEEIYGS
jgi:hypothetical protein